MAKFKYGDRVRNLREDIYIQKGEKGTVVENGSEAPYVLWDNEKKMAQTEDFLEIVREVDHVVLIKQDNSWDDSVEFTPTEMPMDLPVDKFEFRYVDEYGRSVNHIFKESEGDYDLCDVIASFRLFLIGIGWDRKDVDNIIDEKKL